MLDTIGDLLSPYSQIIGSIASTLTMFQSLSGVIFLNGIRKQGSADGHSPMPFVGGLVISSISLKLATILNDYAVIRSNLIGFGINILFLSFFYTYISKKNRPDFWKKVMYAGIFVAVCLTYAQFEDQAKIEARFGMLLGSMLFILIGLPLLGVKEIIRKKSSEGLPFPMLVSGSLLGTMWLLYALSTKTRVLIYQNGMLLLLVAPQLILCFIYPRVPSKEMASKNAAEKPLKKD